MADRTRTTARTRRTARAVTLGLTAVVVASAALAATVGYQAASASNTEIAGTPVDAITAQNMVLAALSCPSLTGARIAAQVLADGPLPADVFAKWTPWKGATADDTRAFYYALAHDMCDLIGQVRGAGAHGDAWTDALAAYHDSVAAVKSAKGVPAADKSYVDTVDGYATWYAKQTGFGDPAAPAATPSASAFRLAADGVAPVSTAFVAVPDDEVTVVVSAGSVCPQVTPARIAAQLMASSGFDANVRSATGQLGVAQFQPDIWNAYAPASASPWDPPTAIRVLGTAMCGLVGQLGAINGDPYRLALAAFRVGPTAVRQAMGVPDVPGVQLFVQDVLDDAGHYTVDSRLFRAVTPSPAPTKTPSPKAAATPSPAASPTPKLYKIVSVNSGKLLSPADHTIAVNTGLVQHSETGSPDQLWQLVDMGDGRVRIKNAANGLSAAVYGGSVDPEVNVVQATDDINTNHEWVFNDAGGGSYKVQNVHSGLLIAVSAASHDENAHITQFGDNGTADHLWRLVPAP